MVAQRGRRVLELECDRVQVRGLDARDRRVGVLPNAPDAFGRGDDLFVGGLDVDSRQGRAVVELDSLTDLERVYQTVGRNLPLAGRVADDLRGGEWGDLDQRAIERRDHLEGGERALLVRIETRRVSTDGSEQYSAAARGFRSLDGSGGRQGDQDRERNDDE